MAWMDGAAGSLWVILIVACLLLAILVVVTSVSLLRRPPDVRRPLRERRRLDQELAAGRISPQEYAARRSEQDSRTHAA